MRVFFKRYVACYLQIESRIHQRDYFKSDQTLLGKFIYLNSRGEVILWIILHNLKNQWLNLCQKKKQKQKRKMLDLTSG